MSSFVGRIVLTINGAPVAECRSCRPRTTTGAKALKGMSPTGLPVGTVDGTPEFMVDAELYIRTIPTGLDLYNLKNATLTITPRGGGSTTVYTGVFTIDVSESFQEEGESTRSVTFGALNRIVV